MRVLGLIASFVFTMAMALFIFAYMLVEAPQTLEQLLTSADAFRSWLLSLGLVPDRYSVRIQVLLEANQIVLIGIAIAVRIAITLITIIVNGATRTGVPDEVRKTQTLIASFVFTMATALFIFAYMLVETPQTLQSLLNNADALRSSILSLGLVPDRYSVWILVLLRANAMVLIGISIAVRIAISIIMSLFSGAGTPRLPDQMKRTETPQARDSPFKWWGQRS